MFGYSQKEKDAALRHAFNESSAEQVIHALKKGANPDVAAGRHGVPLFAAFSLYRESNVAAVVEALVIKGANVNVRGADGNSPLHYAASYNKDYAPVVQKLISVGADLLHQNDSGDTPLLTALRSKNWRAATTLLESGGGDINTNPKTKGTLLTVATAFEAPVDLLKALLKTRVDINAQTLKERSSALHLAAQGNQTDAVKLLLEQPNLSLNLVNKEGRTPLQSALEKGAAPTSALLIAASADVNVADPQGVTPLITAARQNFIDVLESLLKAGAKADCMSNDGQTPLAFAAQNGAIRAVKAILSAAEQQGVTLDLTNPLCIAAERGHGRIVELLLQAGAEVDGLNRSQQTALMCAAKSDNDEVLEILLKAGADPAISDAHNLQAYDHAIGGNRLKAKAVLGRFRADTAPADAATATVQSYGFTRLNDHSLEVREGAGLTMTFNFWTQQVIVREMERGSAVVVQNFADIQRQDAITEAYEKLKSLGGTPPDPAKGTLKGKPGLQQGAS